MAGDYSRLTFDPRKRFAAVTMQQGRVQLDADWNEEAAIMHARMVAQARETFGRAAASRFGTINAFRIGMIAGPPRDLSIEPGRYWLEGHLALALPSDGSPITYLNQPFLPGAPPLPPRGPAIVWLETWQREVTWVEDPSLLDVALGGVDTAARLQSVWQVRVEGRRDASCALDLNALFPPSPARLTTAAVAPPAPEDPCLIAPKIGYRGLENRFYRVEVHRGGNAATARFKWSRDNASVRSPVLTMRDELRGGVNVTVLSVARIGRDPGLRINAGDWVEITDEHRFLNGESGEMAQVAEPPLEQPGEDGVQVVLDRLIPSAGARPFGANPAALAARRTRIIRWDQLAPRNGLDAGGLMAVGTAAVALEEGIEVTFSLADGGTQFRAGDYWTFAARTADASVEALNAAEPLGPRRHHAMLASFANIAGDATPSDCRTIWPPQDQGGGDGCCTMVVRPGEDVQAALDQLGPNGGCVCLKPGVHELRDALRIRGGRISLHAEAPGAAILRRDVDAPILVIGGAAATQVPVTDVHVAGLVLQLGSLRGEGGEALLVVDPSARRVRIEDCRFTVQDFADRIAAVALGGTEADLTRCVVERLPIGVLIQGQAADIVITDCAFDASDGRDAQEDAGLVAVWATACGGALRVERNAIRGYQEGIVLARDVSSGRALDTDLASVLGNVVLRTAPPAQQTPTPVPTPAPILSPVVDIAGIRPGRVTLRRSLDTASLRATATRSIASEAEIRAIDEGIARAAASPASIAMGRAVAGLMRDTATLAPVAENPFGLVARATVAGPANLAPFAIVANAENATVAGNLLAWGAPGYAGILAARGTRSVTGNDLLATSRAPQGDAGTGVGLPVPEGLGLGIVVGLSTSVVPGADGCSVDGNVLLGSFVGILVGQTEIVAVRGNLLARSTIGIATMLADAPLIEANQMHSTERGVLLIESPRATVAGNSVIASRQEGIQVFGPGTAAGPGPIRISRNALRHCGVADAQASAIVASLLDPAPAEGDATAGGQEVIVEHNLVAETGVPLGGKGIRAARCVAVTLTAPRISVNGNAIEWEMAARNQDGQKLLTEEGAKANRALLVLPAPPRGNEQGNERFGGTLTVTDNRIRGFTLDSLVEVRDGADGSGGFSAIVFGTNLVEHWGPVDLPDNLASATVVLRGEPGATVAVAGNVVRGPGRRASFRVDGPKEIAFAGNATTGPLFGTTPQPNVIV